MEILNRKARFDYFIEEEIECGIELLGNEVKSIRNGSCNIKDSYALIRKEEVFVVNMFIKKYENAHLFSNESETRQRKLLLHKTEIKKLDKIINNEELLKSSDYYSEYIMNYDMLNNLNKKEITNYYK